MSAPVPSADAGMTALLGGRGNGRPGIDIKKLLLFGAGGALLGMLLPIIPGGPIGGAAIGAGLALLIK